MTNEIVGKFYTANDGLMPVGPDLEIGIETLKDTGAYYGVEAQIVVTAHNNRTLTRVRAREPEMDSRWTYLGTWSDEHTVRHIAEQAEERIRAFADMY